MVVVAPLVALGTLALVLWIIAFVAALAVIIGYIAGILHGLPYPIDQLAGPVNSLSQGLSNVAGKMFSKAEQIAGGAWHAFARYLDKTWEQMEAQAHLAWAQTEILAGHIYDVTRIRKAVDSILATFRGIEHGVKDLRKLWHGIEARVKQLEHDWTKGIGHDLRLQVGHLERDLGRVEHKVIPALEADIAHAGHDITALRKWVTDHIPLVGTAAFAGAVAWALSSIGLGGLRCPSLLNSLKNRGCGLWNGLEDLLGLFVDVTLFTNVCAILDFVSPFVSDVAAPIVTALTDVGAGLCEGGIGAPPALPEQTLYLPTSPGVTLNLP